MKPAILLLHFRNSPHTQPCLDSLTKLARPVPIYIISIQSTDTATIEAHRTQPIIINTKDNKGFAWANNQLIKRATADACDTFILLNNDTTVEPDFVDPLIQRLKTKQVGMVCPKIYFYPGNEFHHDAYKQSERGKVIWYAGGIIDWANVYTPHWGVDEVDHGQFDQLMETDFATGCCLAITKETIEKIGLMDEKYFLYFEDADWSMRAKKAGLKIVVEPKSIVYHKNAGSTGGSGSTIQQRCQKQSRLRFGLKYAPWRTKLHLLKNAVHDSFSA